MTPAKRLSKEARRRGDGAPIAAKVGSVIPGYLYVYVN